MIETLVSIRCLRIGPGVTSIAAHESVTLALWASSHKCACVTSFILFCLRVHTLTCLSDHTSGLTGEKFMTRSVLLIRTTPPSAVQFCCAHTRGENLLAPLHTFTFTFLHRFLLFVVALSKMLLVSWEGPGQIVGVFTVGGTDMSFRVEHAAAGKMKDFKDTRAGLRVDPFTCPEEVTPKF